MSIPVSKWADPPLVPAPNTQQAPTPAAAKLLGQVAKSYLSKNEVYSVTNSPLCCPEGKNYLIALKPYWWEDPEGSGNWVRRDGCRNPLCDKPQSQKQLQDMGTTVSALAWGSAYLQDGEAAARAEQLLKVFFIDEETRMLPQVLYAQVCLGDKPMKGNKLFAVASRFVILVSQSVNLLPRSAVTDGVRAWMQEQLAWMDSSEQGAEARESGNNVEFWYHALYSNHLAALDPAKAASYATERLAKYLSQPPEQLLQHELERSRPRHYVLFAIEPLTLIAGVRGTPPADVIAGIARLVEFARTVPAGQIEAESDNDARHAARLAWFERIVARWEGKQVPDQDPDGSAWEGGWNQRARLTWALI